MKYIHTADWHVGASKFLGPDYLNRAIGVIDSIVDLAVERKIDTILVAGDIFDVDEPSPEEQEIFLQRLLAYDRMGIRILAIRGNHDQSNMQGQSAIRYLAHMTDHGVFQHHVFTERTQYIRLGDNIVILLCHRPRYFREDFHAAITALKTGTLLPPHKHCVMVAHECLKGSISDTNWRMTDGVDVPLIEFGDSVPEHDLTYIAMGDIHIQQKMGPRAFYSGAPLQVKFGDQDRKGVLIVDTDNPENPEFVPIISKRLVKVVATTAEDLEQAPTDVHIKVVASPQVYADAAAAGLTDAVVKFEVTRTDVSLEYTKGTDLSTKILDGLAQVLTDGDLELARREASALFSQVRLD